MVTPSRSQKEIQRWNYLRLDVTRPPPSLKCCLHGGQIQINDDFTIIEIHFDLIYGWILLIVFGFELGTKEIAIKMKITIIALLG